MSIKLEILSILLRSFTNTLEQCCLYYKVFKLSALKQQVDQVVTHYNCAYLYLTYFYDLEAEIASTKFK